MSSVSTSQYSPKHERLNIITHFTGFCLGVILIPALFIHVLNSKTYGTVDLIGVLVYGVGFLMVFGFSSLYHYQGEPSRKHLMKIWDHISIYYLIAGTYTPFIVIYASHEDAVLMLWILWSLALAGTVFKIFFTGKFRLVSTFIYLGMGWMIFAAPASFTETMTDQSIFWIALGGIFYTVGVVFYLVRRIPFHHAIWHVFVLGGAISHFIGIWKLY